MERTSKKVVLVGQGYVGLPLAMRAVEVGYDVVGIDVDASRVKRLSVGESYVEDISSDCLQAALRSGRYRPSAEFIDASEFDICVITVPTPLRDGAPDLSCIEQAGASVAPYIRPGCTVVLESTTYPGTTEEVLRPLLEEGSGLRAPEDFLLGYSPERIDPGNQLWRLDNTPKIIAGIDEASLDSLRQFYGSLVARTVPVSSPRTAELTKLFENTFRHINIALVNELAIVAGQLGVSAREAIDAAASKPFGFMPFSPGPGVGGHCLPIDPSYLSWQTKRIVGQRFRFIELANDVNESMPQYVVQRVMLGLNARQKPVNASRVLLLGLAYKKNVGDLRESPATNVADLLSRMGAKVRAVEPYAEPHTAPHGIQLVELSEQELSSADVVIVLTDHDCFDFASVERLAAYVFDTRDRCTGANVEQM